MATHIQFPLTDSDEFYHERNGAIGVYFNDGDFSFGAVPGSDGAPTYKLQRLGSLLDIDSANDSGFNVPHSPASELATKDDPSKPGSWFY